MSFKPHLQNSYQAARCIRTKSVKQARAGMIDGMVHAFPFFLANPEPTHPSSLAKLTDTCDPGTE